MKEKMIENVVKKVSIIFNNCISVEEKLKPFGGGGKA